MTDFKKNAQSDPHGSRRKMLSRTLDAPNPWCALTHFPLPKGNQSGCWDHEIHGKVTHDIMYKKERESGDIDLVRQVYVTSSNDSHVDRMAWWTKARDFDLLDESVPQVRVSARTLVLLFQFSYHLTPFFSCTYIYIYT